jgi:formate hydrogenlyase subunit 3/multisubunit Na+/H+ antiporter MnhD subunit
MSCFVTPRSVRHGFLFLPLSAGLLCLARARAIWWERLNLLAFAIVAGLAAGLGLEVAALGEQGAVTALGGFLRADALSALVIGLTAFVALVCAIYAVGYFRRDLQRGPDHGAAIAALLRADAVVRVRDAAGAAGRQPRRDVGGH